MPTEEELRELRRHAPRGRRRIPKPDPLVHIYGYGYLERRKRNWDLLTLGPVRRAGERVAEVALGLIKQTDALFSKLSDTLGTKVIEIDRTAEPTFSISLAELYAQDQSAADPMQRQAQQEAEELGTLYFDHSELETAIAAVRAASRQVTQLPVEKTMALALTNGAVAHIKGYSSFEEILTKVEYGFPENELPELLNLLRGQRQGIEEVSSAFAHQLFYRASVRFVERSMDPDFNDGPERDRLLYFALAIKGLRPDVDQDDIFDSIYDGVYEHLKKAETQSAPPAEPINKLNVISMFDKIRERKVKDGMRLSQAMIGGEDPDESGEPFVTDDAEAVERLAEGLTIEPNNVVPLRTDLAKRSPADPNGAPSA